MSVVLTPSFPHWGLQLDSLHINHGLLFKTSSVSMWYVCNLTSDPQANMCATGHGKALNSGLKEAQQLRALTAHRYQ